MGSALGPKQDVGSRALAARNDVAVGNLFEKIGGESRLRLIISAFIDRVFEDRMIGFFFRNADRQRIKELEYQLAAEFLGAGIEYQGRPLGKVHANHPIMGGHFARRRQIFKETLEFYQVDESIKAALLNHTDSLRPLITPEAGSNCDPLAARERVNRR
ncbi:MAG: group 1 truncated hemoglobin [Deltaproteobacteria bacterium]|nr:MAG: group 1 truncated hemoglobin [Deltaproteobacteria bacterium]